MTVTDEFPQPKFDVRVEDVDDHTRVLDAEGEIHVSTAPEFSRLLNDAIGRGKTAVVLDLSSTEFIDSTGLSVLLNGLRLVTQMHGRLALVCTNPTVLRLFLITSLIETFDIFDDRTKAIAHVLQGAGGSSAGAP